MAKRKKVNKTKEVKKYLTAHPGAKPSEVVEALKQYGVSPTYVSNIKSNMKGKRPKKTRGAKKRASTKTAAAGGSSRSSVIAAAELISICGSAQEALMALKTAEKVASVLDR